MPCGSPNLFTSCRGCKVALGGVVALVGWIQDKNGLGLLDTHILPTMRQMRLKQQAVAWFQQVGAILNGICNAPFQTVDKLVTV